MATNTLSLHDYILIICLYLFVCLFFCFFTGVFHVHTALAQRPTQPKRGTSQSFSLSPFLSILFVLFLSLFWLTKRNIMRYTSLWISVYNNHPIGLSLCVHNGVCVCLIPIRLSLSLSLSLQLYTLLACKTPLARHSSYIVLRICCLLCVKLINGPYSLTSTYIFLRRRRRRSDCMS